jgi:hypothetical protein
MKRSLRARHCDKGKKQSGYAILIILLMLVLMTVALIKIAPVVALQLRRDQEEEMIHRGRQYVRAIHLFYRKFGRYPNSIQELLSTNNLRFLRRQYKDPITGQDFRLLHPGEATFTPTGFFGQSLTGQNGTNNVGVPISQSTADSGQQPAGQSAGRDNSLFEPLSSSTSGSSAASAGQTNENMSPAGGQNPSQSEGLFGDTLGGGPIIGVAGTSKEKSIKLLNGKDHYKDWQFLYDPRMDTLQIGNQIPNTPQGIAAPMTPVNPGQPGMQPQSPQQ